ncbi:hypothetical protein MMC10_011401 [Thelotrema lepadinum]|nr:hypothetical protein [Thelotrema lepadinum]
MHLALSSSIFALCVCVAVLPDVLFGQPTIGIQRDFGGEVNFGADEGPHSYSAIIEFEDKSIPGDSNKMSDAQFINLVSLAYDEMIEIWKNAELPSRNCPGAIVAMESEGRIYFASSIRSRQGITWNNIDVQIEGSVGWYQEQCRLTDIAMHRYRGGCGEPNVLRLYGDTFPPTGDPPRYQAPPTTDTSPRMVAFIIIDSTADPWTTPGYSARPCRANDRGYGCDRFVDKYGLKPIQPQDADTTGQDDWKFEPVPNPRQSCDFTSTGSAPKNTTGTTLQDRAKAIRSKRAFKL